MNLRTTFTKIVARAGCKPWPRLFQNLRASCETDWVEKHPAHECAAWLGHSPAIAAAHYLQARNHHFEAVVNAGRKSSAESSAPTAQNRAQQASATSRKASQDGTETNRSPRVITVLPSKTGVVYKSRMGEEGLEPPRYYSGNTPFPSQDSAESSAESDARSMCLDAIINSWGLLTADDRRRIIAIVNGRLA